MIETTEIQEWLAMRFPAEDLATAKAAKSAEPAPMKSRTAPAQDALDETHQTVLREIFRQPSWRMSDFRVVAVKAGLMPWACFKTLNEWAQDTYADLLLEGDQVIKVNQELARRIKS